MILNKCWKRIVVYIKFQNFLFLFQILIVIKLKRVLLKNNLALLFFHNNFNHKHFNNSNNNSNKNNFLKKIVQCFKIFMINQMEEN